MIETLTSTLVLDQATTTLCYYQNVTHHIQIIRIEKVALRNPLNFISQISNPEKVTVQWSEKVIFPRERVLFYAVLEASLEIHTSTRNGLVLVNRIPCSQLQVLEK